MKKLLTLFVISIVCILACLAADYPRWVDMPITVYIPPKTPYTTLMQKAFAQWQNKSNETVRFKYVNTPNNANIEVSFVEFVQNCNDNNAVGCASTAQSRGAIKKSYIEIGTKQLVRKASGSGFVTRSPEHLYGVMIHEVGHALGLGHSTNPDSIMYTHDLDTLQTLTKEDLKLLYNKYH